MVIRAKTVPEFENEITEGIESRDPSLDTRIGPIKDLYITPPSEVFKDQHDNIVYLSQLMSLKNAARFNPEDLDDFVYNEAIVRWEGSPSYVTVTFARIRPPTADILVPINFPLSTVLNPETGEVVDFRTVESRIMYGPLSTPASAYYNAETERYELNVACASIIRGSTTQVGAYTITVAKRPFPQFDEFYNKFATTSGLGRETNSDLAARYLMQVEGHQTSTPAGLARFLEDTFSGVIDTYVVYGNNVNLEREQDDAGAVDMWILGDTPLSASYDIAFPGVETLIPLPRQPISQVNLVTSAGPVTYIEGTDYEVIRGEGVYGYSNRAQGGIKFLATGSFPAVGTSVHIEYQYNSLINVITSYYRQSRYFVMGSDVLFRWAQPQLLSIEGNLTVTSGNPDSVVQLVRDRITNYINALRLGEDVEEFDLDAEISKVFGVGNWTWTTLAVQGGSGVGDLAIGPNRYARIEAADLVVNLVS